MAERVRIGRVGDFADGDLHAVDAAGTAIVVGMVDGQPYAARNHCPHLGFSLSRGPGGKHFADGEVVCPWHNSRFDFCTGENLDWVTGVAGRRAPRWSAKVMSLGRKPAALTTYPVTVEGGEVFVEI